MRGWGEGKGRGEDVGCRMRQDQRKGKESSQNINGSYFEGAVVAVRSASQQSQPHASSCTRLLLLSALL